jgi:hypothetical protein
MDKKIPTYLLIIDEELSSELQVDCVSMVDAPAIERNFLQFRSEFVNPNSGEKKDEFIPRCISYVVNEGKDTDQAVAICNSLWEQHFAEKTYNDYPKEASENAKVALRWAEENGWGECGTPVGKARANQLANGEAISRDTIARMSAFERQRQNSNKELGDGCGRLMWLAWGGDAGVEWATKKLKQIDKAKEKFSIQLSFSGINEDKQELFGPAMLADVPIYRNDGQLGEYNVVFDKATIYKIAQKFFEKDFNKNFNLMHDPNQKCTGVYAFQSYIVDSTEGRPAPKGYEDAKDGSWFLGVKVNNAEVWSKIKSGEIKGFSVEGVFEYKKQELTADENIKCSNCNHSWNTSDSKEADKYVCHNCGFDNSAEQLYNQIKKLLQEVDS